VAKEEIPQNRTVMKIKSAIDQAEELAPRTLKEIVHVEAKTLGPEASVQEACDELRSEGMTSSPVTDKDGQLLGTVSASELNRKVGGFGHDPKIELAQTELNQETVYCFEDQSIAEAEKSRISPENKERKVANARGRFKVSSRHNRSRHAPIRQSRRRLGSRSSRT
jgi:predicted transcriptional regulator